MSANKSGNFRDFSDSEILVIAPVISYKFSDATSLIFEYEYLEENITLDEGIPNNPVIFELPRERFLGEPDNFDDLTVHRFYLTLDHRFSDNIRLRSGFAAEISESSQLAFPPFAFDPESNLVSREFVNTNGTNDNLSWQTDLISEFNTGSVEHQLLAGFELSQTDFGNDNFGVLESDNIPLTLDIFNPQYGTLIPSPDNRNNLFSIERTINALGLYLQDQVTLLPNLKLLAGGRYDFAGFEQEINQVFNDEPFSSSEEFDSEAFSPRVGLVYQPIEPISLYGSYSRSFIPNNATTSDGEAIEPERGTQFEVGARGEFDDITVNLAAYDITKTNVTRTDPDDPDFSIPVGEVKSR